MYSTQFSEYKTLVIRKTRHSVLLNTVETIQYGTTWDQPEIPF